MSEEKKYKLDSIEFIKSDVGKSYFNKINEMQRHRFSHALDSELLSKIQLGNDFQILSENLLEWQNKIDKKDKRWSVLNAMSGALLRMYFYANNLETTIKTAIAEYQDYREKNNNLLDANMHLRNEVETLKKQVEYYERENNI